MPSDFTANWPFLAQIAVFSAYIYDVKKTHTVNIFCPALRVTVGVNKDSCTHYVGHHPLLLTRPSVSFFSIFQTTPSRALVRIARGTQEVNGYISGQTRAETR